MTESPHAMRLVPIDQSHGERMLVWMQDPALRQSLGIHAEPSAERTRAWIEHAMTSDDTKAFAIFDEERHIGNVVLDRIDRRLGTTRLSIYLGEAGVRGRGNGRRALRLALGEAFQRLGLHKVWLIVHAENVRAIAAYVAAGFSVEGVLRDEFLLDGRRMSVLYMGILAPEFLTNGDRP